MYNIIVGLIKVEPTRLLKKVGDYGNKKIDDVENVNAGLKIMSIPSGRSYFGAQEIKCENEADVDLYLQFLEFKKNNGLFSEEFYNFMTKPENINQTRRQIDTYKLRVPVSSAHGNAFAWWLYNRGNEFTDERSIPHRVMGYLGY